MSKPNLFDDRVAVTAGGFVIPSIIALHEWRVAVVFGGEE
jgi:hypothetical protein